MSAKFISSLTEENPDLRKQIGCMTGIFQLFDRHRFLSGNRISHNQKRLLLGANHNKDPKNAAKTATEKSLKTLPREKLKVSSKLYQASDSSSAASSTGRNIAAQKKPESFNQINMPEASHSIILKEQKISIPDVVKDSMYREARSLSIKSKVKDGRRGSVVKHIDSPRPSLREATNPSKDEHLALPRLSYDERELQYTSKSKINLREFPRLSLDSKASSLKSSATGSRCGSLRRDLHMENEKSGEYQHLDHEAGNNRRLSNVVAKLMGLEAFPDATSTEDIMMLKVCLTEDRSSKAAKKGNLSQISSIPDVSGKESASTELGIANPATKPISNLRFPLEPAPWRQQDTSQPEKPAPKGRKASQNTSNTPSSVYGEMEKRIKELEFEKSGRDLRALKQILEAMQKTRQRLENQKEESEFASQSSRSSLEDGNSNQDSRLSIWKNQQNSHQFRTSQGTTPIKRSETSIVTMKPAKGIEKIRISRSTSVSNVEISNLQTCQHRDSAFNRETANMLKNKNLKDRSPVLPSTGKKNNLGGFVVEQTLKAPRHIKVESLTAPGRGSGILSSRSPQKKHGTEKQSHPTTPSSDPGKVRNLCSKQLKESGYPNRKLKLKQSYLYQGDAASVKSESNYSLESQIDTEITSMTRSIEMNDEQREEPKLKNPEARFKECMRPVVDITTSAVEQPSPVSVLDATFYGEESPSPVKKIITTFKEDESPSPADEDWHLENLNHSPQSTRSSRSYKFNHGKLEDINHLIHRLRLLNANHDEVARYQTSSICESLNPDQQYITKILLASGLLRDGSYIPIANKLHSSCYLINPELFHVLEQTEENIVLADEELYQANIWLKLNQRLHRKNVFDTVNEILVRMFSEENLLVSRRKRINGQKLLKEVQLEVKHIQRKPAWSLDGENDGLVQIITEDMMHQSADWTDYMCEIPSLVLDIERLIFKDLITEIAVCEISGLHGWPRKHWRQLFTK